jgi:uncharacterized protein
MRCPVDGETLVMTERYGIEIDYCPKCRGVWLDRGELDKMIDRALAEMDGTRPPARSTAAPAFASSPPPAQHAAPVYQPEPRSPQGYREDDRRRRGDDDDDDRRSYKKRRKESFLGELFDF